MLTVFLERLLTKRRILESIQRDRMGDGVMGGSALLGATSTNQLRVSQLVKQLIFRRWSQSRTVSIHA